MRFLFGDHVLDTARRELSRSGERIELEPQVFDLLIHLLQNRERVVSKDDLLASVWGGRIVSDATLDSRIAAARRPLPRPQRWAAAVATLTALQDEYRAWLDNLPASLEGSRLSEKLQAITELDLEELHAIDPPRGYGRD